LESSNRKDFVPEAVKKVMRERTNWGDLMEPKQLDFPEQDKIKNGGFRIGKAGVIPRWLWS
jgi:hypothetical protein